MKKNFVIDTNVVLDDPHAILKFGDNSVIVPITVIEEVDKFKRDLNTVGRNAREFVRLIDGFRNTGNLSRGVQLENGGTLRVITNLGKEPPLPFPTLGKTADSLILASALLIKKKEELPVVFVTRDINLRLRADAVGLNAVNYEAEDMVPIEELYSGKAELVAPAKELDRFRKEGYLDAEGYDLISNQCVTIASENNPKNTVLGRFHRNQNRIVSLLGDEEDLWGIYARNREQCFAVDLLLDDTIQLVTLTGKAGTGKTLLAIAAGIRKALEEGTYSKIVVARPIMPLGKELGFLPGELGEKLHPWMEPVFDNLELIMNIRTQNPEDPWDQGKGSKSKKRRKHAPIDMRQLMERGILEVQALTYIRGRSLPGQYLVIDEAQNLTHHEVKTIVTRAGENTKVVLTGDLYQIDNPFLDSTTSGLSIVVEKFKNEDISGHMDLIKGERSPLAELASHLL